LRQKWQALQAQFKSIKETRMKLKGKKICIPVAHEFEDIELLYPLLRLSEEGAHILIAAYYGGSSPRPYLGKIKPITGRFGTPIPPVPMVEGRRYEVVDALTIKAEDFDAVVIPGGFCPDILRREPYILNFVRQMDADGKPVAAICHGPWLTISAGVVKGRRVTSFFAIKDDLINAGALWEDSVVVVDRNLITSRCPDDLPQFCLAVIDAVAKQSQADVASTVK
jgi:protease I